MSERDVSVQIRSFEPGDQASCAHLYAEGLAGRFIPENDTGVDLDNIQAVYMKPGNHFWVAEAPGGKIVGMVGVQNYEFGSGEIRRLRVDPNFRRRGIGTRLVETAVQFCEQHNYLKITLDTFMDREPAIRLFEKFHFRHFRTRRVAEKELMYFLLDLYAGEQPRKGGSSARV